MPRMPRGRPAGQKGRRPSLLFQFRGKCAQPLRPRLDLFAAIVGFVAAPQVKTEWRWESEPFGKIKIVTTEVVALTDLGVSDLVRLACRLAFGSRRFRSGWSTDNCSRAVFALDDRGSLAFEDR